MNEPNVQSATDWAKIAQDTILAIRSTGAVKQEILVSGTGYDSGSTWDQSGNASILANVIHDPAGNMAFEIHQYLDRDASGYSTEVVSPTIGAERLTSVTQWGEGNGVKLFLSEFGSGSDAQSLVAMKNMLNYVVDHNDVWQGAAIWGGGPWWGDYDFSVEPSHSGAVSPQVSLLKSYASTFPGQDIGSVIGPEQASITTVTGNNDGGITLTGKSALKGSFNIIDTVSGKVVLFGSGVAGANGTWSVTSHVKIDTSTVHVFRVNSIDSRDSSSVILSSLILTDTGIDRLVAAPDVSEVFSIMSFKGSDFIDGFQTAKSVGLAHDFINFSGRGITSFNQVQAMMTGSSSTTITIGSGKTVTLIDVTPSSLTASDFRFS